MEKRDIIVIGASAGGIDATQQLLKLLPEHLDATIFIVIHLAPNAPSLLARVLARGVNLPISTPADGQIIEKGHVYVAPANQHMLIKPGSIRLGSGPRENRARPSVDALFRTAAFAYNRRVIGIILSGALNDGTAGLMTIKSHGGLTIVQSLDEATFTGMPKSAIEFVEIDHVMPISGIAEKIVESVNSQPLQATSPTDDVVVDKKTSVYEVGGYGLIEGMNGENVPITCPECGGVLWQSAIGGFREFKCHVGHGFTPELLLQEQADAIDAQFWKNLRQLEENIWFRRKLAQWARDTNKLDEARQQEELAKKAELQAEHIRQALLTDINKLDDAPYA